MTGPSSGSQKMLFSRASIYTSLHTGLCYYTKNMLMKRCVSMVKWQRIIYAQQMSPKDVLKMCPTLQSWTKMLRKMHLVCLILDYFPPNPVHSR